MKSIGLRRVLGENVVLSFLVVVNLVIALAVVYSSHEVRASISKKQQLEEEKNQLQTKWRQMVLENGTSSRTSEIELVAREKLGLQVPEFEQIVRIHGE